MQARGPDAAGYWEEPKSKISLVHRRLTIIDVDDRSNQPMVSTCGRYSISYNGEIYNYRALRKALERDGVRFRTESDTEVVLAMFAQHGTKMFQLLRGMYSLAIWDTQTKQLLLARDPYGIKPLYYFDSGWSITFASSAKALATHLGISNIEPAGACGFYMLGSVPEPWTIYSGIFSVPAGSYIRIDATGLQSRQYFFPSTLYSRDQSFSLKDFRSHLHESVAAHMTADVEVGVFLSAGLDSSIIALLASQVTDKRLSTITLGFEEYSATYDDEFPNASRTAELLASNHCERLVSKREFLEDLPQIQAHMDQPTIDGINTWFVSKACAEQGIKTALSGLGGDEFGEGYPAFDNVSRARRLARWVPGKRPLGRLVRALLKRVGTGLHPKRSAALEYADSVARLWFLQRAIFLPHELKELMPATTFEEGMFKLEMQSHLSVRGGSDDMRIADQVGCLESSMYMSNQLLRDSDWASMAHSVEVRVPFVDLPLLERWLSAGNPVVKQEWLDAFPELKPILENRAKTGFTTPLQTWRSLPAPWARAWAQEVLPFDTLH